MSRFTALADPYGWEAPMEAVLARAAAQGRRDGLCRAEGVTVEPHEAEAALDGAGLDGTGLEGAGLPAPLHPLLRIAVRHCYAAGHRHGAEVRRENDRRLARQEPPLGGLAP